MVTLKCLIGVSGQIQVRSVPDLIGRSGQSGQVNLTCRAGPDPFIVLNYSSFCFFMVAICATGAPAVIATEKGLPETAKPL